MNLAVAGVDSTIFEPREKAGGLNEYGIAAYKTVDDFAAREVDFILSIGGIEIRRGQALGRDVKLEDLRRDYDAVFLGAGLGATNKLGLPRETELENVIDAVDYIAAPPAGQGSFHAAGRPAGRGDRRRHDGDRRRRAVEEARRRDRDHGLPARARSR